MILRRDLAVVGALVIALAVVGVAIVRPAPAADAPASTPSPLPEVELPTYREGVVGRPVSITPLTARTRAERTLVGLIFSGLTRIGPTGLPEPDLAKTWTAADGGKVWTFILRDDALWHDGTPVTSADVVHTVGALKDPDAPGPFAASWTEVTVRAIDDRTVRFTLTTPLAAFPEAASQPLIPAHLLADVPVAGLATDPFASQPIGTGPYALASIDDTKAVLEAFTSTGGGEPVGGDDGAVEEPPPTDSLATPAPPDIPDTPLPYLPVVELHFFDDAAALEAAFRAGSIHVASGLAPDVAAAVAAETDGALEVRYPSTTLSTVLLDQRPTHPELRDARVRRALLGALDRDALIRGPLAGGGLRAPVPYPPTAPRFDPDVATPVPYDPAAAAALLTEAGWTTSSAGWVAPGRTDPYRIELLVPAAEANPAIHALALAVADAWRSFGLIVDLIELEPAQLAPRLEEGSFTATVVDVRLGPELDLFPLLASSQTRTGGGNVVRYQDPALDGLLAAARSTRGTAQRAAAVSSLIAKLAADVPILPLAWRDDPIVVQGLDGVFPRLVVDAGDRFRDVLAWRLASGG